MAPLNTFQEILEFAIKNEQESIDFYTDLAHTANNKEMKQVFEEFAQEEVQHKAKLLGVKDDKALKMPDKDTLNLKIADYTVSLKITADISYSEILTIAMQKEKAAYRLYSSLAQKANNTTVKEIFLMLAQEEAKHKLRFEIEYDETVLKNN